MKLCVYKECNGVEALFTVNSIHELFESEKKLNEELEPDQEYFWWYGDEVIKDVEKNKNLLDKIEEYIKKNKEWSISLSHLGWDLYYFVQVLEGGN